MSIDKLQKSIRKLKNPLMVAFSADSSQVPPQFREGSELSDCVRYTKSLLLALKDTIPAVRFDFGSFAVLGPEGVDALSQLLQLANEEGYYVLLDAPEMFSSRQAELVADGLFTHWCFDGLLLSCYLGTDTLKPFTRYMKENDKDLFVVLRAGNKSSSEIQDLLTGSRFVHTAAADLVKRLGESFIDRCGYSRIAGVGPATAPNTLQNLRNKYPSVFLLADSIDYSGANAKNCAEAFDKLGHGAIACVSSYVTGAWQDPDKIWEDPVTLSVQAAERLKKNLSRYVTIL